MRVAGSNARWPVALVLLSSLCPFSAYALLSQNPFSDDDRNHYLAAHYSWIHPQLLVDIWARPAYTVLSSPLAQFGIRVAGIFNILVSLLACYLAFEIARTLGVIRPWLAAAFTALQPLVVQLSFGTLTEPLFSVLLASAVLFYQRHDFVKSALCMSLLPLARMEGFAFLMIWLVLLLTRGHRKAAACLLLFPFLWNTAGFFMTGEPFYVWRYNPYGARISVGAEPWWDYFVRWPTITGPALLPLITGGLVYGFGRRGRLVPALAIVFVLLQTAVYSSGLIGRITTNEAFYLRLFVGVAPLLGVMAAQGVHCLLGEAPGTRGSAQVDGLAPVVDLRDKIRQALPGVLVVQAILMTWWFLTPASPVGRLHLLGSWLVATLAVAGPAMFSSDRARASLRSAFVALMLLVGVVHIARWTPASAVSPTNELWSDIGRWFVSGEWHTRTVIAINPAFWMAAARDPFDRSGMGDFNLAGGYSALQASVRRVPAGTVVVWDSHYFPQAKIAVDSFDPREFRVIRSWATSDDPGDRFYRHGEVKAQVVMFEKIR